MRKKQQPVSNFTAGFQAVCFDKGWVLPNAYVTQIYEEGLLKLEARIAELEGARTKRIDPINAVKTEGEKCQTQKPKTRKPSSSQTRSSKSTSAAITSSQSTP